MKEYNTRFAIMEITPEGMEFIKDGKQVALYTMREAKKIVDQRKATTNNSYSLVPHVG